MLVDNLRAILIIDEVFEEYMLIFVVRCFWFVLFHLQFGRQLLVDKEDGLTKIINLQNFALKDETCQKDATSQLIVLTMHINFMTLTNLQKILNGIDGDDQLIQWQVGIVLKAKMMDFPFFIFIQHFVLKFFLVFILSYVPYLIIWFSDMTLQIFYIPHLWICYVIKVGNNLHNLHLFYDLVPNVLIFLWYFLNYRCFFQFW